MTELKIKILKELKNKEVVNTVFYDVEGYEKEEVIKTIIDLIKEGLVYGSDNVVNGNDQQSLIISISDEGKKVIYNLINS